MVGTKRCTLTPQARQQVNVFADQARSGGYITDKYKLEDEAGFYLIGEGSHRFVYAESISHRRGDRPRMFTGGDCVVKIDTSPDPWSTRNEILNYATAPDSVKHLLAPITQASDDGQWLVMENAEGGVTQAEIEELEQQFLDAGILLSDIRQNNVGYLDGEPVVIDYGFKMKRNAVDLPEQYKTGDPEIIPPPWREFKDNGDETIAGV